MNDSTPVFAQPSTHVLQSLRAFARAYRPKSAELEITNFTTAQGEKSVVLVRT